MTERDWRDGYRAALADFLREHGKFVKIEAYNGPDEDDDQDDQYDDYALYYSWDDHDHLVDSSRYGGSPACEIAFIAMHTIRDRQISQFNGTFADGDYYEMGVEVIATCTCGKYENKWLRWTGSMSEILPKLLQD